jgi:NitT/TauT family transport system permease protein
MTQETTTTIEPERRAPRRAIDRGPARPPSAIARLWEIVPDRLLTLLVTLALLALAEVAARNEWVSRLILAAPTDVVQTLWAGLLDGIYWRHAWSTLQATLGGFALAAVSAIAIAGMLASIPRLERVFLPIIVALQTVPKIAIAPLIILWLGFGGGGKLIIVTIVCFFPILVNTLQGLRMRDRSQLELMQSLGATRWQMFRYVRVPNALPFVFAGFHISILFALLGAIVAEFVGSRAGLGWLLLQSRAQFNVAGAFAILILLMVIGSALYRIVHFLERRIVFWAKDITAVAP